MADEADLIAASRAYRLHRMGLVIDGTPFSLREYPWCIELIETDHPNVVIRKGAQLGFTVAMILRTIDMSLYTYPRGVLYLMPTRDDVSDFSRTRFDRFLKENQDTLGRIVQGTDNVSVKRIGQAFVYFRGAKSRSQLKSIPVDAIVTDEEDEMDPASVLLAEHRLDGSKFKHHFRVSTPSIPDFGVDYHFARSDQRHWKVKCSACGRWQCLELEWPSCLQRDKEGRAFRACVKCGRKLESLVGEFVPAVQDATRIQGFYISQICSPTVDPTDLLDEWESGDLIGDRLKEFFNSRLGLPHADIEDLLDERTLREASGDWPQSLSDEGPCIMGCDIGKSVHHYMIGAKRGPRRVDVLAYGSGDFNHLSDKIRRFNVQVACFDMMAEMHAVRAFQRSHGCVWGVIYSEAQRNAFNWQPREKKVTCNRTEIFDQSHRAVISGDVRFPRAGSDWQEFVKHMTNVARTVVRDPQTGVPTVRWVVRGRKNDHLRHAFNYLMLAAAESPISLSSDRVQRRAADMDEPPLNLTWMSQ